MLPLIVLEAFDVKWFDCKLRCVKRLIVKWNLLVLSLGTKMKMFQNGHEISIIIKFRGLSIDIGWHYVLKL